jgi:hypothetical protein
VKEEGADFANLWSIYGEKMGFAEKVLLFYVAHRSLAEELVLLIKQLHEAAGPARLDNRVLAMFRALCRGGAPPELARGLSIERFIAQLDHAMRGCTDPQELAVLRGTRALADDGVPAEDIFPLAALRRGMNGRSGKRPDLKNIVTLSIFSAAVTVLKKGSTVSAAIAEVATPNRISRKDLKNFRDRLNRGRAGPCASAAYRTALTYMEGMTKAELLAHLSRVSFVPNPP